MTTIKINSNSDHVILDFDFLTPQEFFYTVEVSDGSGNDTFNDKGQWNGKISFDLGAGTALVGLYLSIFWSVLDPAGAGNAFDATATATQNWVVCPVVQEFKGTSTSTSVNDLTVAQFTT